LVKSAFIKAAAFFSNVNYLTRVCRWMNYRSQKPSGTLTL
jgi:hypothetical protein